MRKITFFVFVATAILMAASLLSVANNIPVKSSVESIFSNEDWVQAPEDSFHDPHFLGNLDLEKELELVAEEVEEEDWKQSYKVTKKDHYSSNISVFGNASFEAPNTRLSTSRMIEHSSVLAYSSPHTYLLHSVFII